MATMNISLTDELKSEIDEAVSSNGYVSSSEYIRDVVRYDLARRRLKALILEGLNSGVAGPADDAYFDSLRDRIRERTSK